MGSLLNHLGLLMLGTLIYYAASESEPSTTTPIPVFCSGQHQFWCSKSETCIARGFTCNNRNDCTFGEDEEEELCPKCNANNALSMDKFYCPSGQECIEANWQCDGFPDCDGGEDEVGCDSRSCTEDEFPCGDGQCINKSWRCDQQPDCKNHKDEMNCTMSCGSDEYRCAANGTEPAKCVKNTWKCDGERDCPLGDDEDNCGNLVCPQGFFQCEANGKCNPERWLCDGDNDCENGYDESEEQCKSRTIPATNNVCTHMEFACKSGSTPCILSAWKCDGAPDCSDGSDEEGCSDKPQCSAGQFQCDDLTCIPEILKCSGKAECPDSSDEKDSMCSRSNARVCDITKGEFSCMADGSGTKCIDHTKVCDGKHDCGDGQDEAAQFCGGGAPTQRCGTFVQCGEANCTEVYAHGGVSSIAAYCFCEQGYQFNAETKTCEDINECAKSEDSATPVCDQVCINLPGSYKCECEYGFSLEADGMTCKATQEGIHPKLLFTNRHQIRALHMHEVNELYMSLIESKAAVAIDFDYSKQLVFFSDMFEKKIFQFKLPNDDDEGTHDKVDLAIPGVETPDGLAYDWTYQHLYWTDTSSNTINMACIKPEAPAERFLTLYKNSNPKCVDADSSLTAAESQDICIDEPRALVLHPKKGLMFWSDWGNNPNIVVAALDGSFMEKLVYNSKLKSLLEWPNGLTLDFNVASRSERLYWIDAKLFSVFSCNIDNCMNDATLLAYDRENIKHPFSITVFENKLFWSDWHHKHIVSANKFTGENITRVLTNLEQPMDLKVFHPVAQPANINHCETVQEDQQCDQICVPKPWKKNEVSNSYQPQLDSGVWRHTCLCATGYTLQADGRSCEKVVIPDTIAPANRAEKTVEQKSTSQASDGMSVGVIAAIAASAVLVLGIGIALVLVIFIRRVRRNKNKNMNFDNPIYKRTTEDKLELPRHEYQPSQTMPSLPDPTSIEIDNEGSVDIRFHTTQPSGSGASDVRGFSNNIYG